MLEIHSLYDLVEVVVPVAMLPVLARRHRPHVAFGWLFLLLLVPVVGLVAWLFLGFYRPRRERRRRGALRELDALRKEVRPDEAAVALGPELAPLARLVSRLGLAQLGGWPVVGGNRVTVLDEPGALVDHLVRDVEKARHGVDLLFYLFAGDASGRRVAEALEAAAARG
ncbi:MAG: DUF4381 family protein, partial [Myxococcota bacterium]|nr:DUF4381 family protein [Myxococcota bacterium]